MPLAQGEAEGPEDAAETLPASFLGLEAQEALLAARLEEGLVVVAMVALEEMLLVFFLLGTCTVVAAVVAEAAAEAALLIYTLGAY